MNFKRITDVIKNNDTFLLGTHQDVEGDALGSVLAMYMLLRRLKKKAYIYHPQQVPVNYKFMPSSFVVKHQPPKDKVDCGIILDCSDITRLGKARPAFINADILVNIDHHISNTKFADINVVEPKASSACEIVYKIYKRFYSKITKDVAVCLYAGIFTDTGSFTYSPTTSYVHKIVSELLKCGVHPVDVYHNIYSLFKAEDVSFIGKVLSSVQQDKSKKVVWVKTNRWIESTYGDLTEAIFHNLRSIRTGQVFVLFKKFEKNTIRVNFRSNGKFNVNRIARFFGGGGHKNAAGASVRNGSINSVEKKIISFIKKYI